MALDINFVAICNDKFHSFILQHSRAVSPSVSSLKSCISTKPMKQERELPEKWVDTRIFPIMTKKEITYARKDQDLLYKRKYFIYSKDRMRNPFYNLELDGVVKNTEEHQRRKKKMLEIAKEEEEKEKLKRIELEKRWDEMNEGNADLWKNEQKTNEKKWRERLMRGEKRRQELEAQWEEVVVQFKKKEERVKKKR